MQPVSHPHFHPSISLRASLTTLQHWRRSTTPSIPAQTAPAQQYFHSNRSPSASPPAQTQHRIHPSHLPCHPPSPQAAPGPEAADGDDENYVWGTQLNVADIEERFERFILQYVEPQAGEDPSQAGARRPKYRHLLQQVRGRQPAARLLGCARHELRSRVSHTGALLSAVSVTQAHCCQPCQSHRRTAGAAGAMWSQQPHQLAHDAASLRSWRYIMHTAPAPPAPPLTTTTCLICPLTTRPPPPCTDPGQQRAAHQHRHDRAAPV
jgi:hypothetical protein